jgi:hypothetical protein
MLAGLPKFSLAHSNAEKTAFAIKKRSSDHLSQDFHDSANRERLYFIPKLISSKYCIPRKTPWEDPN